MRIPQPDMLERITDDLEALEQLAAIVTKVIAPSRVLVLFQRTNLPGHSFVETAKVHLPVVRHLEAFLDYCGRHARKRAPTPRPAVCMFHLL